MKTEELKKFYIKQMERLEGALARKFTPETYSTWWTDGVKRYGYTTKEIEYAVDKLSRSDDKFPILSTFIYYCSEGRREVKREALAKQRREEEKARDLSPEAIFDRGAKTARSPKAQAVIKNAQRFLRGEIDKKTMAKNQEEIEKGE